jgi:hypothetical protein
VRLDPRLDFFGEIVSGVVVERDVRAFASKDLAKRGTYPTRSAGYERTLSFK